jgi:putative tricarboxylic transport membrane protein
MSGDRVFACIAILLVGIYGYFAFFDISAPIQYDPLGPEGWPRFLAIMALLLSSYLLWRPVVENFAAAGGTAKRILLSATMLAGYAFTFEWLGFALATTIFCAALARLLGAGRLGAIVFGIVAGVGLYVVAVHLLGLNLPVGEIYPHGTGAS